MTCPLCGGELSVEPCTVSRPCATNGVLVIGREIPRKSRETVAVVCSGCEFAVDLYDDLGRALSAASLVIAIDMLTEHPDRADETVALAETLAAATLGAGRMQ